MDCRQARKLIPLGSGGDLEPEEQERLERHLMLCPDCSRLWKRYRQDRKSTALLRSPVLAEDVRARLARRRRVLTRSRGMEVWMKVVAAACLAFALTLFLANLAFNRSGESPPGDRGPAPLQPVTNTVEIPGGAYERVRVKGGTDAARVRFERCNVLEAADTASFDF